MRLTVLHNYSLADLVKPHASMRALLGIETVAPRRAAAGAGR